MLYQEEERVDYSHAYEAVTFYKLRDLFVDVVDRLYSKDNDLECDEVHADFQRMADILGVYLPERTLSLRLGSNFEEYIEDILLEVLPPEEVKHAYSMKDSESALKFLESKKEVVEVISKKDLEQFCLISFYEKKRMEANTCAQKIA